MKDTAHEGYCQTTRGIISMLWHHQSALFRCCHEASFGSRSIRNNGTGHFQTGFLGVGFLGCRAARLNLDVADRFHSSHPADRAAEYVPSACKVAFPGLPFSVARDHMTFSGMFDPSEWLRPCLVGSVNAKTSLRGNNEFSWYVLCMRQSVNLPRTCRSQRRPTGRFVLSGARQ